MLTNLRNPTKWYKIFEVLQNRLKSIIQYKCLQIFAILQKFPNIEKKKTANVLETLKSL